MARRVEDRSSFIAADSSALSETHRAGWAASADRSSCARAGGGATKTKDHRENRVNVFIGQLLWKRLLLCTRIIGKVEK
jgi:hypothetical protein